MRFWRSIGVFAALLLGSRAAAADIGFGVHAEGGAAHMVGDHKVDQYGWGAAGLVAPALELGSRLDVEMPLGAIGLGEGRAPEPGYEEPSSGSAFFGHLGLRVHPFAKQSDAGLSAGGLWLAGGGGVARTGSLTRPSFGVRLGFDARSRLASAGPFVGLIQIVQPDSEMRPEDGRVAMLGLHGSLDPSHTKSADADRDHDGIPDLRDECPDDPEDYDGYQDSDGCPDLDNDGDGIPDVRDQCPNEAEDFDGFEDSDGCPDPDNDRDGIPDARDKCPNEPEDMDGFEDSDGCPDPDNDQDGIPDARDQCPNEPETLNGFFDDDGCPDEADVHVAGDRIELDDRVHFRVNGSEIQGSSWGVLTSVAKLLSGHPEYVLVHIAGHADDTGDDEYNMKLSDARARAVKAFLVRFGVDADRLTTEAYGKTKPLDRGRTLEARSLNRRVEFTIVERRSPAATAGSASGQGGTR